MIRDESSRHLFNNRPPQYLKEVHMNELTVITPRDKWENEMEKRKAEAERIAEEFKKNPNLNPFEEVTK